jgi:hypothetical protein
MININKRNNNIINKNDEIDYKKRQSIIFKEKKSKKIKKFQATFSEIIRKVF